MEKELIEAIKEIYHYMQYGKLMPGFIHNINGKITAVDSKLQITSMKTQMKIKKLDQKKEEMSEEIYESMKAEYDEILKVIEGLKAPMSELTGLLKVINDKVFEEGTTGIQMLDINRTIQGFCEFFKFYKRFKHDTDVQLELDGNPYIKMESKDLYQILYVISRNAVDSTFGSDKETNILKYTTVNNDDHVVLKIFSNGSKIEDESKLAVPLYSTKKAYNEDFDGDEPRGAGLDLYFLKMILDKYQGYDHSLKNVEYGTEFEIKLLKR